MCTRLLESFAVCILFLQFASMQITFAVPENSYGFVESVVANEARSYNPVPYAAALTFSSQSPTGIVFVGDVLLARNVEFLMKQHGSAYPYQGFDLTNFADKPYVVGNFEAAVPQVHHPTEAGELVFSVNTAFLSALSAAGFTHMSLANNHALDHGSADYYHTVTALADAGVAPFGHPHHMGRDSVIFLPVAEGTVALIGVHTLTAQPSVADITSTLSYATMHSDLQVVYVHWGSEYQPQNDQSQRQLADDFVSAGADLIIGHHPHVVQNIELINGVPVVYSLGNYIFDQYDESKTQESLVVFLEVQDESIIHLQPVTSVGMLSQPRPMSAQTAQSFLDDLASRSDAQLTEAIRSGSISLDSLVATSPKMAMMNR